MLSTSVQSGNSYVFGSCALSQENDYFVARERESLSFFLAFFFARKRETKFWCFFVVVFLCVFLCFWGVFLCFRGLFFVFRALARKKGFFNALSQAKPGIPALPPCS